MASTPMSKTALIVIDVQVGLDDEYAGCSRSNPLVASNVTHLLEAFRASSINVMHVQHLNHDPTSYLNPSKRSVQFEKYALPKVGEPIFTKTTSSAFVRTGLEADLRSHNIQRLVIAGFATDHCISSAVRSAVDLDIVGAEAQAGNGTLPPTGEIVVVGDATCCYSKPGIDAETVQKVHLASLNDGFCRVVSTQALLNELRGWA